ncbi:hypothetical protein BKD03_02850 [Brucella sp. 09RB8471]|nr:hypothetical protein BKD03_02850 [Brucella sp. 09RB8471]
MRIATGRLAVQETQRHGPHRQRANRLPLWVKRALPGASSPSPEVGAPGLELPFWSRSACSGNRYDSVIEN